MKRIILATTAVFTVALAQASSAQTAGAAAQSGSNSASGAVSILNLDQSSGGTSTLKTAPPVSAPSMGSGHPCGLGASAGISIIGGGISGGNSRVDEACLLAQMGQGGAALVMIAARDGEACRALRQVGRIKSTSVCKGDPKPTPTTSSKSVASSPSGASNCRMSGGKVHIKYPFGADKASFKSACLTSLGY